MNQNDVERFYFNQNMIYHKDKTYNSGGSLEVSICSSTTDYKTFSAPTLHVSVIGENNLRRLCSLSFSDAGDLLQTLTEVIQNSDNIYSTNRNNVVLKKYQFDRSLKFELIYVQTLGERTVSITVTHSSSDFTKVIISYNLFLSLARILKAFVNDFLNISFTFTSRNLLTELLEQNKLIRNGIQVLPSMLIESYERGGRPGPSPNTKEINVESENNVDPMEDFDKFLGKDMENIKVSELDDKSITEEKPKNLVVNSLFVTNTLNKDLSVLESMLTAATTRPDPIEAICSGFARSMNLDMNTPILQDISKKEFKSLLYTSKFMHDLYLTSYLNKNTPIPSSFPILKYTIDVNKVDVFHVNLAYDLLLISGFIKIFRSRMESRVEDANKNGALFYLRIRTFLDSLIYSFIDETKGKIISNTVCTNFEKYAEFGFFNYYQKILTEHNFNQITVNDIRSFCDELNNKIFGKGILTKNICDKQDDLFKSGFLKIKSDNNLTLEQIINELIPLEILEKGGLNVKEDNENLNTIKKELNISEQVLEVFRKPQEQMKENTKKSNLLKTVKFFNNEIPERFRNDFFNYVDQLELNIYDFDKFPVEELGENIVKTLYLWNTTDKRDEPLTTFRLKLDECVLTKDLIITSIKTKPQQEIKEEKWDLSFE